MSATDEPAAGASDRDGSHRASAFHTAWYGRALCVAAATVAALALFGHAAGMPYLTIIVAGQPPMQPNTAVALLSVALGGALRYRQGAWLPHRVLSVLGALLALAIGVATLFEYLRHVDLGIDRSLAPLLMSDAPVGPYPGRPSPPTALALTLLSTALLLFDVRPRGRIRPSEGLILAALCVAFVAFEGFLFGAGPLYRLSDAPVTGVAVPTSVSLLLVCIGLLLERPDAGVMRIMTSSAPGGILLRRIVIPAVVAPALLGPGIALLLPALGVADLPLVTATLTIALIGLTLLLLTLTALPLNRAHDALEGSRARLRDLVEQASDGIFLADLDGRYTDVNSAGCRMLGLARDEIVGTTIRDLLPADEVERLEQVKERLLRGETVVSEWTLRRKDGRALPVEVSSKILADGRWQGFVRDISDRKRLEEDLRLALARSSGILSISADAIISVDDGQGITMFNDGAEQMFGYSKAEAVGTPLEQLIPERYRADHRRHVERFAAGPATARRMGERRGTIFALRKNGEEFPADAAISKLHVGGTTVLTVALRDITEQKRIEREEQLLGEIASVLGSTLDYEGTLLNVARLVVRELADVCIVETLGQDGRVDGLEIACRDPAKGSAAEALGRATALAGAHRCLGSAGYDTGEPVIVSAVTPAYLQSVATNGAHLAALQALGPESFIALPLTAHARLLGRIVLVSTAADHRFAAADLRLAQEVARRAAAAVENAGLYRAARRATQARDDMLGIVAHDLRNPLATITLDAHCLRLGANKPLRSLESIDSIELAAGRMRRLISDLLDLTRIESGGLPFERRPVSVERLLRDCAAGQKSLAAGASLELELSTDRELPDVWADADRLLQVLENLVGNAVRFTPAGGRITIGAARAGGAVRFSVGDTGAGISAEHLPHVFDRFWQGRKGERHGAGLGLPIVKGIVESHGGSVWVESSPGRGSTFFFTIPQVDTSTVSRAPAAPGPGASSDAAPA